MTAVLTKLDSVTIIFPMEKQIPGKRQLNKLQLREAILKASRRLFSSAGYDSVKMEDIAEMAGVSRATLYNYFPNKESLLTGTLDTVYARVRAKADKSRKAGLPPETMLYDTFSTLVCFTLKYSGLTRRISYLNALRGSSLYNCLQPVYDLINELIDEAIAEGKFRESVAPEPVFETMLGMYYVILYNWDYEYPEDSREISVRLRGMYDFNLRPYMTDPL